MGVYGSPELYPFDEKHPHKKKGGFKKTDAWYFFLFSIVFFTGGRDRGAIAVALLMNGAIMVVSNTVRALIAFIQKKRQPSFSRRVILGILMVVFSVIIVPKTTNVVGVDIQTQTGVKEKQGNHYEAEEGAASAALAPETEDDYRSSAQIISYDDLLRNPDKHIGEVMYVDLKVSQVLIGGLFTESGYAGEEAGDEWYIHYDLSKGESRILEGDTVRFYGEFAGLAEMKQAVTNTKVSIPRLEARYRD